MVTCKRSELYRWALVFCALASTFCGATASADVLVDIPKMTNTAQTKPLTIDGVYLGYDHVYVGMTLDEARSALSKDGFPEGKVLPYDHFVTTRNIDGEYYKFLGYPDLYYKTTKSTPEMDIEYHLMFVPGEQIIFKVTVTNMYKGKDFDYGPSKLQMDVDAKYGAPFHHEFNCRSFSQSSRLR